MCERLSQSREVHLLYHAAAYWCLIHVYTYLRGNKKNGIVLFIVAGESRFFAGKRQLPVSSRPRKEKRRGLKTICFFEP